MDDNRYHTETGRLPVSSVKSDTHGYSEFSQVTQTQAREMAQRLLHQENPEHA